MKIHEIDRRGFLKGLGVAEGEAELKAYKRASAGDAINRQNIANRTGKADPKIAKRNAGQERAQKRLDKGLAESLNESQFKSKEEAVAYAKERVKTFRDKEDGIEVWAMPDGSFDVNHTMNSSGRNHIIDNGGKKLGTVRP